MFKKSRSKRLFDCFNILIMFLLILITTYPFLYVIFVSVSEPLKLLTTTKPLIWPLGFTLDGYKIVFQNVNIFIGYRNTTFYVIAGTSVSLFMTTIGAYVLTRKGFKLHKVLSILIIFTMFFSGGMVPRYFLIRSLGLYNNQLALILPGAISTYNLLVMRTAIMDLPHSIEESAFVDGANDIQSLFYIVVPLIKQTIAVMALFYGVAQWNGWFDAMLFLRSRTLFPLQLFLREILISNDVGSMISDLALSETKEAYIKPLIQYCTIIVTTVPILFVYPFLQKYFVKGMLVGAVKQ